MLVLELGVTINGRVRNAWGRKRLGMKRGYEMYLKALHVCQLCYVKQVVSVCHDVYVCVSVSLHEN